MSTGPGARHPPSNRDAPICRPDSDCWDVQLLMFDPENERRASRVYRYTVDVSDVLPVTVGADSYSSRCG